MTLLHLFDLDGTLMYGSAAPVEISRQLGVSAEIAALERSFGAGEIGPHQFSVAAHALWSDLTPEHVRAAFEGLPGSRASGTCGGRSGSAGTTAR